MLNVLINTLVTIVLLGTITQGVTAGARQPRQEVGTEQAGLFESPSGPTSWFRLTSKDSRKSVAPPTTLARVVETVTDSAALSNLWLHQMVPNLTDYGTCAEVSMAYAPEWEAAHRNWAIVKVGCPTKLVDADGNIVGWHMPECQGTLPGTSYPLRCRFDPSEI
jgi:hypothetical protein